MKTIVWILSAVTPYCIIIHLTISFQLDYAVTWQKLKDIFKVVGPVVDVEIMDNHKGNAMAQFTCADDAIKAIGNGEEGVNVV